MSRTGRKWSSLEDMEKAARGEADGTISWKVRGVWLEVQERAEGGMRYKWGVNVVPRDVAHNIVVSAQAT